MTIHLLLVLSAVTAFPDTPTKPAQHPSTTKKASTTTKPGSHKLKNPVPVEQLKAVTARGKLLWEYEGVAGPASDSVIALKPSDQEVTNYFMLKKGDDWTAVFGHLNEKQDKFLITYEAMKGKNDKQFTAKKLTPAKEDDGFYLGATRAVAASVKNFTSAKTPYNTYVLPGPSDQIYVYFLPAPTRYGVYPYGADARFLYSKDGATLIEKRQLHPTLLEDSANDKSATTGVGVHSHTLTDLPEDSDVFHVLQRRPPRQEYISTKKGVFVIAEDGSITQIR
jgi:hypothetical protein